jgi:putative oxidoreductase
MCFTQANKKWRKSMDFKKLLITDAGWGMFVLRIVTGIIFIGHGAGKFGWGSDQSLAGLAGWLGSIGIPLPMVGAFLVAFFETFGGGAGLAFAMLIAVALVHLPNGMFAEGGYQWALLLMACSLALMFEGAGNASLDKKLTG